MEVGRVQERNPRFIILTPNMYGLGVAGWFSDVDLEMDIRALGHFSRTLAWWGGGVVADTHGRERRRKGWTE